MKLSVHLVTWNGSKYIENLFDSLRQQTFKDLKLVILDNASSDDTVEKITEEIRNWKLETGEKIIDIEFIVSKENKGFAGGHNEVISNFKFQISNCDYILLLNQDMYLMPDCIEKLVKFMDEHADTAITSPRLMKWNFNIDSTDYKKNFTDKIDSLGLKIFRNRRVVELFAGQDWENKSDEVMEWCSDKVVEVFGVSGALPMFRRSVIDEVGLFDESFGSYKEDLDLAYRLRSAGYKSYVVLDAVAYHDRSAQGLEKKGDLVAVENKKKQSEWVRYNSYRNHLITLIKNEYWQNYLLDLPWIKWYELKKFCYFLMFDRGVLRGLVEIIKEFKDLKIKRFEIVKKRKIGWREMRKWWK